jgi:hypothetical protein
VSHRWRSGPAEESGFDHALGKNVGFFQGPTARLGAASPLLLRALIEASTSPAWEKLMFFHEDLTDNPACGFSSLSSLKEDDEGFFSLYTDALSQNARKAVLDSPVFS